MLTKLVRPANGSGRLRLTSAEEAFFAAPLTRWEREQGGMGVERWANAVNEANGPVEDGYFYGRLDLLTQAVDVATVEPGREGVLGCFDGEQAGVLLRALHGYVMGHGEEAGILEVDYDAMSALAADECDYDVAGSIPAMVPIVQTAEVLAAMVLHDEHTRTVDRADAVDMLTDLYYICREVVREYLYCLDGWGSRY